MISHTRTKSQTISKKFARVTRRVFVSGRVMLEVIVLSRLRMVAVSCICTRTKSGFIWPPRLVLICAWQHDVMSRSGENVDAIKRMSMGSGLSGKYFMGYVRGLLEKEFLEAPTSRTWRHNRTYNSHSKEGRLY